MVAVPETTMRVLVPGGAGSRERERKPDRERERGRDRDRENELEALRAEVSRLHAEQRSASSTIAELTEAVAARDILIASAGHELRNPMGALILSVSAVVFRARTAEDVPAWVKLRLESVEKSAKGFVRRATALLDVQHLAEGTFRLEPQLVDLGALVHDVAGEVVAEADRAGCKLTFAVAEGVTGTWDRCAIEKVFSNLVSNAIKYGAGRPIEVTVSSEGGRARLQVRDHGAGIVASEVARVFERFERAVSRRDRPGFGLGLWIARQILLAHGGELAIESEAGAGSVFTATLPR